jgi:hypothetical protein
MLSSGSHEGIGIMTVSGLLYSFLKPCWKTLLEPTILE